MQNLPVFAGALIGHTAAKGSIAVVVACHWDLSLASEPCPCTTVIGQGCGSALDAMLSCTIGKAWKLLGDASASVRRFPVATAHQSARSATSQSTCTST
ncbi:hypothetical protein K431DRAFT_284186 [Polychaeton citri CBS 116435]|uniref:Uncharacterized protein n=1 Tax=Polychaeton citri CBS 116435 TaxID=1314669 RepID=A0A9P4Q7W6_9PEZI|nr:hypothetical protein K431DRAFT_284186 [Polychaeton citri CBS 116435]